jgi:hypothetical protein
MTRFNASLVVTKMHHNIAGFILVVIIVHRVNPAMFRPMAPVLLIEFGISIVVDCSLRKLTRF